MVAVETEHAVESPGSLTLENEQLDATLKPSPSSMFWLPGLMAGCPLKRGL